MSQVAFRVALTVDSEQKRSLKVEFEREIFCFNFKRFVE
jgi:hypothetical protein